QTAREIVERIEIGGDFARLLDELVAAAGHEALFDRHVVAEKLAREPSGLAVEDREKPGLVAGDEDRAVELRIADLDAAGQRLPDRRADSRVQRHRRGAAGPIEGLVAH